MKILADIRRCAMSMLVLSAATPVVLGQAPASHVLRATTYNSNFPAAAEGGEAWNGISVAQDGTVYYVLSSPVYNVPAQMYFFNPKTKAITHIANLNDAVGQGNVKAIAQGKSHVSFVEGHGKLYFSTHLGYYTHAAGVETAAAVPKGYGAYPGGHFISYDIKTGEFENLAIAPHGEGIITFAMDVQRDRMYGITWPTGHFLRYDLKTKNLKDLGTLFHGGETGVIGDTYRSICRRIVIDPRDGSAYFTTGEGTIYRYSYDTEAIAAIAGVNLKRDYFGQLNPAAHGMAYNWRAAIWDPSENVIYGVNGRSGYLFRFDPKVPSVDILERLTSMPSKRTGMFDEFDYGYLGLTLAADGHTLYYLTGSPLSDDSKGDMEGERRGEGSHLITYDISTAKYVDHGQIMLDNGDPATAPQSLAVAPDGTVYTLCYVARNGKKGIELINFHP
jgi:hypothetical protein